VVLLTLTGYDKEQPVDGESLPVKRDKFLIVFLIVASLFLGLTYLPLFAEESTLDAFAREDGIFENLTAIYLFFTSMVFAIAFFRFRKTSWLLKLSYAGLALLFFLGAGEEISWGERIFGWNEPNSIREINVQGELSIHNLKYFQGEEAVIPISVSQLFVVFAVVFAVLIPLLCKLSPKIEQFVASRFPVLPGQFGVLVVMTYIYQKAMLRLLPMFPALYQHSSMPIPQGVHEIREHGFTFALLAASIFYFFRENNASKVESSRAARALHPVQ
jgi:hypothetical protein